MEPKRGKLATVRADGRPHLVPVAFDLDEDTLIMLVMQASVKAQNMQRDPRVCLCIDVETSPYAYKNFFSEKYRCVRSEV
jgi:nitroimidazol reductase NimA-like FMN-containing flavoprotein (pyridoxamine 5'-phosphate oxidase superfamily)